MLASRVALRGLARDVVGRVIRGSHSTADSDALSNADPYLDADTYPLAYRDGFIDGLTHGYPDRDAHQLRNAIAAGLALLDADHPGRGAVRRRPTRVGHAGPAVVDGGRSAFDAVTG